MKLPLLTNWVHLFKIRCVAFKKSTIATSQKQLGRTADDRRGGSAGSGKTTCSGKRKKFAALSNDNAKNKGNRWLFFLSIEARVKQCLIFIHTRN